MVDSGCVAMSDLVKQSLYIDKDCGVPRASAIVPHLKERCSAVVSLGHLFRKSYAFYRFVLLITIALM